jgi:hypothetical protein
MTKALPMSSFDDLSFKDFKTRAYSLLKETLTLTATRTIIMNPASGVSDANMSLRAQSEFLALVLLIPMIITVFTHPEIFEQSIVFQAIGYNTFCVGFDTKPAAYVGACLYVICAHFGLQHVHFKMSRLATSEEKHVLAWNGHSRTFVYVANIAYALGSVGIIIAFQIPPMESMWWHTHPYVFFIVTRYLSLLASFVEHSNRTGECGHLPLPYGAKPFMILFGICSVCLPLFVYPTYALFESTCGVDATSRCDNYSPPIPVLLLAFVDYGWLICSIATPVFLPPNPIVASETMLLVAPHGVNVRKSKGSPEEKSEYGSFIPSLPEQPL